MCLASTLDHEIDDRCTLKYVSRNTINPMRFSLFLAAESKFLKILLSFAVGGLLGDVFLHLLPEAWEYDMKERIGTGNYSIYIT